MLLIINFLKMNESLLRLIFLVFLSLLLIFYPVALQAGVIRSSMEEVEIEKDENVEAPKKMTQKQMNDLFGEDPYLGQTSYLQSPDSFSQREKIK